MMPTNPTAGARREPQGAAYKDAVNDLQAGRLETARTKLEAFCRDHPDHARPHALLGLCRLLQHDLGGAKQALTRALTLDPSQPAAFYHLGLVLDASGDEKRARSCFASALSLDPEFAKAQQRLSGHRPAARKTEIDIPQTDEELEDYKKRIANKRRADFWADHWYRYPFPIRIARVLAPTVVAIAALAIAGTTLIMMGNIRGMSF